MRDSLRQALLPSACVLLLGGTALGCTTSGSEDAGTELGGHRSSLALVSVERFVDAESLPRLVAAAKIARYQGIQGEALLKLLGADMRELETCQVESGLGQLDIAPEAHVELVSVGDISVRLGEELTTLTPRLFPALATTASGFFYAGDAEMVEPRAELDEYVLSARGEAGVGAFELAAVSPGEVASLSLDAVPLEQVAALVRDHALALAWEPEDPRDRIELELYAGGSVLSCAFRDDGHFVLPADQLAALDVDEDASIVVKRVRVVSLDMQGIEAGYARIATTRTLDAHVK